MATTWSSRPDPSTPLDRTLRRLVVVFRILGWLWMLLLVVLTLVDDPGADAGVATSAAALATILTIVTFLVARDGRYLGSVWYVALDGVFVLVIGAASTIAGAQDLFHGGFLISWVVLAAYAGGRIAALVAAAVLTVEQVVVHLLDDKGLVPTAGSVIFFIFAFIVGWTVDALRASEAERLEALEALEAERMQAALTDERVRLADRIHDTVLQALHAIRLHADDPTEVRYLARQQERDLRRAVADLQSPFDNSFRVALLSARDEAEDMYGVEIDVVLRHDASTDARLEATVDAAREAMLNAAHHSGSDRIELFSERTDDEAVVIVRDHGSGYDTTRLSPHRGIGRCVERIAGLGGRIDIASTSERGTECTIRIPLA